MEFIIYIVLFFIGGIVGSFLNVCIARLPKDESIVFPPSHCPKCRHNLSALDLIPVLSYILLGGKCRYCRQSISPRYIMVEIATILLFIFSYLRFYDFTEFLFAVLSGVFLLLIFFIDLETMTVPDEVCFIGGVVGLGYAVFKGKLVASLIGGAAGFAFFFLLYHVAKRIYKREAIGEGDVVLGLVMGLIFGWPQIILVIFLGYLIGAVVSIALLLAKIKSIKEEIPFGPMLAFSAMIMLFFGTDIINWYISSFWG